MSNVEDLRDSLVKKFGEELTEKLMKQAIVKEVISDKVNDGLVVHLGPHAIRVISNALINHMIKCGQNSDGLVSAVVGGVLTGTMHDIFDEMADKSDDEISELIH